MVQIFLRLKLADHDQLKTGTSALDDFNGSNKGLQTTISRDVSEVERDRLIGLPFQEQLSQSGRHAWTLKFPNVGGKRLEMEFPGQLRESAGHVL